MRCSKQLRLARVAWTTSLALTVAGCGGEKGPTTYPVTVRIVDSQRQPIPQARVSFRSEQHHVSARGVAGDDGVAQMMTFEPGDGAVEGVHQVAIGGPTAQGDPDEAKGVIQVMPRFSTFERSNLTVTVDPDGENDFELQVETR